MSARTDASSVSCLDQRWQDHRPHAGAGPDAVLRFSYRASSAAWAEYWKPVPAPGWHDLLALTKREEATLEGDLHLFMTHLQYFKDVLALPRLQPSVVPA